MEEMKMAGRTLNPLEQFLLEEQLSPEEAMQLLDGAVQHRDQVMARTKQVMTAMEALDDERFTPETLRAHPAAMRELEEGASVGEVYRKYFLKHALPVPHEREANLGWGAYVGDVLSPEQIQRISDYVSTTGYTYDME